MYDDITGAAHSFASGGFRLPQGEVRLGRFHSGAISRTRMLRLLLNGALDVGVQVEIGRERDVIDALDDADLVIAADGASSATRNRFREEFGAEVTPGRGRYIWCGAVARLDSTVFLPVTTPDGLFVAHAYPYGETRSTFVIEASTETLDRAGFGDRQWSSNGASDDEALTYLSKAFSELLDGGSFSGNRSRWGRFNTVRCARRHHDKIVLLGDAATTAHPSLASGTKIATESAIALADALAPLKDEPFSVGLERFEAARRPEVERLQERGPAARGGFPRAQANGTLSVDAGPDLSLAHSPLLGAHCLPSARGTPRCHLRKQRPHMARRSQSAVRAPRRAGRPLLRSH